MLPTATLFLSSARGRFGDVAFGKNNEGGLNWRDWPGQASLPAVITAMRPPTSLRSP